MRASTATGSTSRDLGRLLVAGGITLQDERDARLPGRDEVLDRTYRSLAPERHQLDAPRQDRRCTQSQGRQSTGRRRLAHGELARDPERRVAGDLRAADRHRQRLRERPHDRPGGPVVVFREDLHPRARIVFVGGEQADHQPVPLAVAGSLDVLSIGRKVGRSRLDRVRAAGDVDLLVSGAARDAEPEPPEHLGGRRGEARGIDDGDRPRVRRRAERHRAIRTRFSTVEAVRRSRLVYALRTVARG